MMTLGRRSTLSNEVALATEEDRWTLDEVERVTSAAGDTTMLRRGSAAACDRVGREDPAGDLRRSRPALIEVEEVELLLPTAAHRAHPTGLQIDAGHSLPLEAL